MTTIKIVNRRILKAFNVHYRFSQRRQRSQVNAPYAIFDEGTMGPSLISLWANGPDAMSKTKSLHEVSSPMSGRDGVFLQIYGRGRG